MYVFFVLFEIPGFRTGVLILYIVVGQARTHPMSPSFSLPEMEVMQTILQIMIFFCLFIGTVCICIFDANKTKYMYLLHTYNRDTCISYTHTTEKYKLPVHAIFTQGNFSQLPLLNIWFSHENDTKTNKFSHLKFT